MNSSRKIIGIVNRKGGTAKTTSAAYIATCLHVANKKVMGLDTDPDKSWHKWYSTDVLPYPVEVIDLDELKDKIQVYSDHWLVIDTPPNDPEAVYEVAEIADEIIVPLSPTALDINRLVTTLKVVARIEKERGPLASVLLIKWRPNLSISKEALDLLKTQDMPVLEQKVRLLTRYTSFGTPDYLDEYQAVLEEMEVLNAS